MHFERISLPVQRPVTDNNIRPQYPIQQAAWVTHPDINPDEDSFCRYELGFTLSENACFLIHVSADQRFELYCNDALFGTGPDRSDMERWSFHTYRLSLPAGDYQLAAVVHCLHEGAPGAQVSWQPALILASDGAPAPLHTGRAPWQARRIEGIGTASPDIRGFHVVGPEYILDGNRCFDQSQALPVRIVMPATADHDKSHTGTEVAGWKLFPSRLPEQQRTYFQGGRIRSVTSPDPHGRIMETDAATNAEWQALVDGQHSVTIAPHTRLTVLWDLDNYLTAYPEVTLQGGRHARLRIQWAEGCYEKADPAEEFIVKGNRDAVDGKYFQAFGDTVISGGQPNAIFRPCWWRAGRYIRLEIDTQDDALTLQRIRLLETRYPLDNKGQWQSNDAALQDVIPIAVRGMQMCSHETYMDCPYYEQMMYVGDTRIEMLTGYVMTGDDRLTQRGIELFDWSRHVNGFVLERHPSTPRQLSTTFSMIWILMVRDFAWWRNDPAFVQGLIKGVRCLLEEFDEHRGDGFLLSGLPGWSFMDWVPGWRHGYPPDGEHGTSGVINLLFLNALGAAIELESVYGDPHQARRYACWRDGLAQSLQRDFWDERRGLFADDPAHAHWSEHAQCLALLSGCYDALADRCLANLLSAQDLARTTVYFSFYLFEVLARCGRGDELYRRLDFWKDLRAQGFRTPVEHPEPARSDCHAWGSHPLFHLHASLAGIRPDAPGFAKVRITPQPAALNHLASEIPHPHGRISLTMQRTGDAWTIDVSLPNGVPGTLVWDGKDYPVQGKGRFTMS